MSAIVPRTNQGGKDIQRVLQWLLNRDVPESDIAAALDLPTSNYSRRKVKDDYPNYEELMRIGDYFGLSSIMLQIAFGLRGREELILLNDDDMRLYIEQGGGTEEVAGLLGKSSTIEERRTRLTRMNRLLRTSKYSLQQGVPPLI